MAFPTFEVLVDWAANGVWTGVDVITGDVSGLSYGRGANFDGSSESPGTCSITVNNIAGKYDRDNSGSTLFPNVRPGKRVWVKATYSGTTYALFYGVIRRVIMDTVNRTAELYCEDPLYDLGRAEANVTMSVTRAIRDFRGQVLDDAGFAAGQRNLAFGTESNIPFTYADAAGALSLLDELNSATGSLHYIKPLTTADLFAYTTIDRASLQTAASVASIVDTANVIVAAGGFDLTDEAIVNTQRVTPQVTIRQSLLSTVATFDDVPFSLTAGQSRTIWLSYSSLADGAAVAYTSDVAVAVVLTSFGDTGMVVLTATGAVTVSALSVTGYAMVEANVSPAVVTDATSIAAYGTRTGSEVSSAYIPSTAEAEGLGRWIVERYEVPRMRPSVTVQNDFPAVMTREVGQAGTFTYARGSLSASRVFIRHLSAVIDAEHDTWQTTYDLEEAPAVMDLFTVGGTAAQGVGGTAVLGL